MASRFSFGLHSSVCNCVHWDAESAFFWLWVGEATLLKLTCGRCERVAEAKESDRVDRVAEVQSGYTSAGVKTEEAMC